jgi:hypothetical protein
MTPTAKRALKELQTPTAFCPEGNHKLILNSHRNARDPA